MDIRRARRALRRYGLVLLLALCAALTGVSTPAAQPARAAVVAPLYDLHADEALGGHTIARHVGKTDRELAERLRRERQISTASTYTDLETARRVVASAVAQSRTRISSWARRSPGPRPNLVLNYVEPERRTIGRALARGDGVATTAHRALVVLRWLPRDERWIVLTSYPEARP